MKETSVIIVPGNEHPILQIENLQIEILHFIDACLKEATDKKITGSKEFYEFMFIIHTGILSINSLDDLKSLTEFCHAIIKKNKSKKENKTIC